MANVMRVGRADTRQRDEIDELLLRIKGLVYARAILEERGVDPGALADHSHELERLRERLADVVQRNGFDAAA
ncbi:MAG: hypothetical protein E6G50_08900 [Actinobacteria bacterium]|nr:MAG: hypothetical protein E6G50_08900 [Actinomycetota bacterium]